MIEEYLKCLNEDKQWIQGAIKKPGSLHKALGISSNKKIPAKKLQVKSTDSPLMIKRKTLAKTLKKMHHEDENLAEVNMPSLLRPFADKLKVAGSDVAKDLVKKGVAIALAYVAYRIFNKVINKCHSMCYLKKGSGSTAGEDTYCYFSCRVTAIKDQITFLQKHIGECQKARKSAECQEKVKEKIINLEQKLKKTIESRDNLRLKLIQKGRDLSAGERIKAKDWDKP